MEKVLIQAGSRKGELVNSSDSFTDIFDNIIHLDDAHLYTKLWGDDKFFLTSDDRHLSAMGEISKVVGDDGFFCYVRKYSAKYNECIYVRSSGNNYYVHDSIYNTFELIYVDGHYYEDEVALNVYDYVYCDDSDEWMPRSRYEEKNKTNAEYHELARVTKSLGLNDSFKIGFEVEKEDSDAYEIKYAKVYNDTQWCKEQDGSLGSYGYELVSPIYNLFEDLLDTDLKNETILQELINADYDDDCGGHINLSAKDYSPDELFEGLSAFFPLIYAMFEGRLDNNYCEVSTKHKMGHEREKYSAILIHHNRIEFRIFSAFRDTKNLLWRRDLIRIFCKHINASEIEVFKMLLNKNHKLYKHLRKVYSEAQINGRAIKYISHSRNFNRKNIEKIAFNLLKTNRPNS